MNLIDPDEITALSRSLILVFIDAKLTEVPKSTMMLTSEVSDILLDVRTLIEKI